MKLDRVDFAIAGAALVALTAAGVLWLGGPQATGGPISDGAEAGPPAGGAAQNPGGDTTAAGAPALPLPRLDIPDAGDGDAGPATIELPGGIKVPLPGAGLPGLPPAAPGADPRAGAGAPIPVRSTVALSRTSAEVEPVGAVRYDPGDPYCQIPTSVVGQLQGFAFRWQDAYRRSVTPLSADEEKSIGDRIFEKLKNEPGSELAGKIDPPGSDGDRRYIEALVAPLMQETEREKIQVTVHMVASEGQGNAAMMIGGHMLVFKPLLDRSRKLSVHSEAELMAVLAHEIAHFDRRHLSFAIELLRERGLPSDIEALLALPATQLYHVMSRLYSREMEDEADAYAIERSFRLAYSPYEFERQWRRWDAERPSAVSMERNPTPADWEAAMLASHSPSRVRACQARRFIEDAEKRSSIQLFYMGRQNLQRRIPRATALY
jgi:hypothetical protein